MTLHCPVACRDVDRSDQRKQCTDAHPKCSDWAAQGGCDDRDVKNACAMSCDNCVGKHRKSVDQPELSSDFCVDIFDTATCKFWAEAGECEKNPTVR